MQSINAAYAVLGDPAAREAYDRKNGFASSFYDALRRAAAEAELAEYATKLAAEWAATVAAARAAAAVVAAAGENEPLKPPPADTGPKVKPRRTKAATPPQNSPTADQEAMTREALMSEIKKLCLPSEYISQTAGVMAVRAWKSRVAKAWGIASIPNASISALKAARDEMLAAASPKTAT